MEAFANLGIDFGSVLIYLVNFGILFGVVAYFVTGPVIQMLDERRRHIEENITKAEKIKTEFMDEKKKLTADTERMRTEMQQELEDFKKDLEKKRKEQEESMALKKAKMLEDVKTLVEEEKAGILKAAEKQTLSLIEKIVLHVVSNKVPQDVVKGSVDEAWKSFKS